MNVEDYYDHAEYCPECGKHLERNPISGGSACFLHGEFRIINGVLVWEYTKNLIKR